MRTPRCRLAVLAAVTTLLFLSGCGLFSGEDPEGLTDGTSTSEGQRAPASEVPLATVESSDDLNEQLCGYIRELFELDINEPADQPRVAEVLEAVVVLETPGLDTHLQVLYDATVGTDFNLDEFNHLLGSESSLSEALLALETFVRATCPEGTIPGE